MLMGGATDHLKSSQVKAFAPVQPGSARLAPGNARLDTCGHGWTQAQARTNQAGPGMCLLAYLRM